MPESLRPRVLYLWPEDSPQNRLRPDDAAPLPLDWRPRLAFYQPVPASGGEASSSLWPAVVICPGGGYGALAAHEGAPVAWMLARHGIAALVCYYRIAPARHPAPFVDVARAIRLTRSRALGLGIDPQRIGLMGFSAGGHAAALLATRPDLLLCPDDDLAGRVSARPNRSILAYPVISMLEQAHKGSLANLLGPDPAEELRRALSADLWVDAETPPTFIMHTADDDVVPVEHSLRYAAACVAHGVPLEMHLFAHGHHGVGLANDLPALAGWPQLLLTWLNARPAQQGVL